MHSVQRHYLGLQKESPLNQILINRFDQFPLPSMRAHTVGHYDPETLVNPHCKDPSLQHTIFHHVITGLQLNTLQ